MTAYASWPFWMFTQRSIEDTELWWRTCYHRSAINDLLTDTLHWTLISGGPGSGKSVAIRSLMREEANTTFFIPYPPENWPGAHKALISDEPTHFPQMMAAAAIALRNYLTQNESGAAKLDTFELEFLRWFFEHYLGKRSFESLTRKLPDNLKEVYQKVEPIDSFTDTNVTEPLIVQSQVDELVGLVQSLGFSRLVFIVDIDHPGTDEEKVGLANLFGWLELTHHPGFAVIASVPQDLLADKDVITRSRGRTRTLHLDWTEDACRAIANQHIQQAAADGKLTLSQCGSQTVLTAMAKVIVKEYGRHTPAGWVGLAETLLYLRQQGHRQPLTIKQLPDLQRAFFIRHLPLRVDIKAHGVWRGPHFIRVDDKPLDFLKLLHQRKGAPINSEDPELWTLAGSKGNIHSIASRTRKAIEPLPKQPVYLLNHRGQGGYWLETAELAMTGS